MSVINNYAYYLQINVQDEESINLQKLNTPAIATETLHKITANKEIINQIKINIIPNDNNVRSSNPNKSQAFVKNDKITKTGKI